MRLNLISTVIRLNKMLMYELRNISTGNTIQCRLRTIHGLNWSQYWFLTKCYLDQPVYGDMRHDSGRFYQSGKTGCPDGYLAGKDTDAYNDIDQLTEQCLMKKRLISF